MTITTQESNLTQMQAGVDALSEGFALFDDNDELVFCNTAFKRLYPDLAGFLHPGLTWSVFLMEAQRRHKSAALEQLDAHLSSGIDAPMTLEAHGRGNRWLRLGIHAVDGGGFVLTEADMTDQHQAHEVLEHADDLLRNILDACASRIVLCRVSDGRLLYRTPAWQQTFGATQDIQSTFVDKVDYTDLLTDILSSSRVDDLESTMTNIDGKPFPVRLSARIIDYQGEPAMIMSNEDMTLVHAQRDEIIRINQRLLDAIEALDQGFVLFDSNHQLLLANQRYLDVNKPVVELLTAGTPNARIVEQSRLNGHEPLAAGWPQAEGSDVTAKYEFQLNEENTFAVSRRATSDGGFVIAWRDITEQKNTEQELNRRRNASFQNEKLNALGQLLAGVAHELNNPLSVVVGHAMMLHDEVEDPEALESIVKISRSAERCAKIVKTFLAMARQKPSRLESAKLNDVVEQALEIAAYGLRQQGVKIELHLAEDLPLVHIDEDQVTQVFINLMLNAEHALKDTVDTPTLKITTTYNAESQRLIASVSDNGSGIPNLIRARIFEPFFTTKAVDEGTGVGLALSHRIISSHDGVLDVGDSELGGATFVVSLPASDQLQSIPSDVHPLDIIRSIRVLLIEDEPDVSHVMQKLLASCGAVTIAVSAAKHALTLLETDTSFDLVLCDLRMPGMGGRELLTEITTRWPMISDRFVFVTGDAISDDAEAIRREGKHSLLEKPVSPVELQTLVQSVAQSTIQSTDMESMP